jgi:predicted Zn-dependent peptidase
VGPEVVTLQPPLPGPPRPLKTPTVAERKLRNGLSAYAVRKPGVPKAEVQLVVPTGERTRSGAAERLLAKTLTSGTSNRTSFDIAMELQRLGASMEAGASPDALSVGGAVLAPNLGSYLELLAEVLTDAAFPSDEIAVEREVAVQEITMARSQPQVLAQEAVRKRLFGKHTYALVLPDPTVVGRTGRAPVARLHAERVQPRGANLVIVGDVRPGKVLDLAEQALKTWRARTAVAKTPQPVPAASGPTLIVDRPGAVQTNIRFAGRTVPPGHPDSYALECANGIFGGAATSRLFLNIREDKGYTYSPYSRFQHLRLASYFEVGAEVGTEVTAPSIVETRYELGRMAAVEVGKEELEAVQRYLTGLMALRIQSQRGLAASLAGLVTFGLGIDYLKDYPRRINAVTAADVLDVSERYLAPGRLSAVLVGDASRIASHVEALEPVQVSSGTA